MKKNILGLNLSALLGIAVFGFFSFNTVVTYGQCDAVNPLEIPSELTNAGLNGVGNFNAIVFGNYNTGNGGQTSGRLLVGGNFTLNSVMGSYQVGVNDGSAAAQDNFVLEGTYSNISGGTVRVRGNAIYSSLSAGSAAPSHIAGEGTNSEATGLFDYADLKTYYQTLSTAKSSLPALGTVNVTDGVVTLNGNGSLANYVFNVTLIGGELTDIKYVNIPLGSEILINISNTLVSISPTTGSVPMVTTYRAKTLFNFPNAEMIIFGSFELEGGLLAPKADLSAATSKIKGSVVIGGNILLATDFSFLTGCLVAPLPVTLSSFSAQREGATSIVYWQTSEEIAADMFVIERSATAKLWQEIGVVKASGESTIGKSYSFFDVKPLNNTNMYRLKMIDKDGSFAYSRIVNIDFKLPAVVSFYPNPVSERLIIGADAQWIAAQIEVLNSSGKVFVNKPYDGKDIVVKDWPKGLYLIKLTAHNGVVSTYKIVKN